MTAPRRCVIIPAIKKNAVIPDQLVKRLAGVTLIQRAIDVARSVVAATDVVVITDSEEISLICERNGVRARYDRQFRFTTLDIAAELRPALAELAADYDHLIIYRASCPLLTWVDIDDAYRTFRQAETDSLVTVRSVRHRIWEVRDHGLGHFAGDAEAELVVESKALIILTAEAARTGRTPRVTPYFLNDRAVEINSYQDWWICERLLMRRHVVFVVAGYPAIGMGHIYRALMLAHEIANHKVSFVCTRNSELAARNIAAKDYRTVVQGDDQELADAVLSQKPDLVINDILDTDTAYMGGLTASGVPVVNFEDEGPGSDMADMVFNALYEMPPQTARNQSHFFCGHRYFCLRDEFLTATRNPFRPRLGCLLITFGGADLPDFTRQTLDVAEPLCRERDIRIRVVTGPGYAHKAALARHIEKLGNPLVRFEYATNIMSRMMEGADLAICSAGRTVYELAHMRVPAIVLAQHAREARHTFARAKNGFMYLGIMRAFRAGSLEKAFHRLLDEPGMRRRLHERQSRIDFQQNKAQVVKRILRLLKGRTDAPAWDATRCFSAESAPDASDPAPGSDPAPIRDVF